MTFILENSSLKYILSKFLGEGITCKCYLGEKLSPENSKELLAIKIFDPNNYKYYENEVNYLSKLSNNDNIIKLYDYGEGFITPLLNYNKNEKSEIKIDESQKQKIYFQILEYAPNGELKDYVIGTSTRIPEKISAKLFEQIVQTVKYLHMNNIAHCDIKPENILLDKNYKPKLNDFGFSQTFRGECGDYTLHQFNGTDIYCGPETRKAYVGGFDGVKNDIFSLGVLVFVITVGAFPFHKASLSDEKYKYIIKRNYRRFWECFNYIELSDEFKDLINNLICIKPSQRMEIDQILEHPWIKKYTKISYDNNCSQADLENDFYGNDIIDEFNSRKI